MNHWETNSIEIYSDGPDYAIEFHCLQCNELLSHKADDLSVPFEIDCPNCEHTIYCQLALKMDRYD